MTVLEYIVICEKLKQTDLSPEVLDIIFKNIFETVTDNVLLDDIYKRISVRNNQR